MNKDIKIDPKVWLYIAAVLYFIITIRISPSYISIAIAFFLIIGVNIPSKRVNDCEAARIVRRKGGTEMLELAKKFIDKECLITTFNGSTVEGIIKEISGNAVLLDNKGSLEVINLEFVTRIREYPRNKKGKKKSVVLD